MKIVVTIPAHNESKTIGSTIKKIKQAGYNNIIVVDDGSTDNTSEVAGKAGAKVYRKKVNQGLAKVFRDEMRLCLKNNADVIVHFDADGQYEAKEITKLINKLYEGYDLVTGARSTGWVENMPRVKRWGNWAYTQLVSFIAGRKFLFGGQRFKDSQTGFRVFTKRVAQIHMHGVYTYTMEQLIKANRLGFKIAEIPVIFYSRGGKSRLMRNPFHYAWNTAKDLGMIFYPRSYRFFIYTSSRVLTAIIGTVVLYAFVDRMGFSAWLTNLAWLPISFIISFVFIEVFVGGK